jgi:peroxiredoxin
MEGKEHVWPQIHGHRAQHLPIGRDGKVVKAWRKVSVPGHAEDVQKAVAELG